MGLELLNASHKLIQIYVTRIRQYRMKRARSGKEWLEFALKPE